jgi:lysophospholipase L1-like esterase
MNESFRRALRLAPVLALVWSAAAHTAAHAAPGAGPYRFAFGPGKPPAGYTAVDGGATGKPFYFSVDLPEGNYDVRVTLGDDQAPATTTVKAELRRLMLENVATRAGEAVARSFTVNVRTPRITTAPGIAPGEVRLKATRETVDEARAWDERLTLEFNGAHPAVRTLEITPAQAPTLFLLGDSTVCDQPHEPYNSWGQMLPRFFKPGLAVANHGESGETYRDSLARRRLDKILSVMKPGDTLLMQFGHNDQKQVKDGKGGPFTTYKAEIKSHVEAVRAHGGQAVIVSPMERRRFDGQGHLVPTLAEYAEAARQSAQELGVPFIDLNAMSKTLYQALGAEGSKLAFAEPQPGNLDNTHHNAYGSYELAKAVVSGLRRLQLPVARHVVDDFSFDPAHPDPASAFAVPASPDVTHERPLGDEANK